MAAAILTEIRSDEKPKKTRRTHKKVKTGCITCKIRRKKCDEQRPNCQRCISTGRKCDGYENDSVSSSSATISPTPASGRSSGSPLDKVLESIEGQDTVLAEPNFEDEFDNFLQLWRPPKTQTFQTEQDFYCFDFFRARTGPEFAAYFDSSVFRTFVMRACFLYPTVLQATIAVGAVHRRFELGISPEAFDYCQISEKMYRKTLHCLQHDMNCGNPKSPEISMVVSMLLSIFETFQGNYDSALAYISSGLKTLLRRNIRTIHSESTFKSVEVSYKSLQTLFTKLELRANKIFGTRTTFLSQPGTGEAPQSVPKVFESLDEARDILFTEVKWIWHSWALLEQGLVHRFSAHHTHISRLLEWSMAYAEFVKADRCPSTPINRQKAQLLKISRETAYLLILTQIAFHEPDGAVIVPLCYPPETCDVHTSCKTYAERKQALNAHYARLLILAESIFDTGSIFAYEQHSLSVDSGIGPPLYLAADHCRSTKVRHQVTSLLEKSELQKKVWDTLGVYTIAERLASIEEHAVLGSGAIPARLDPKWIDITCFLEENKILLRHCREDERVGGLLWTQEWISF